MRRADKPHICVRRALVDGAPYHGVIQDGRFYPFADAARAQRSAQVVATTRRTPTLCIHSSEDGQS